MATIRPPADAGKRGIQPTGRLGAIPPRRSIPPPGPPEVVVRDIGGCGAPAPTRVERFAERFVVAGVVAMLACAAALAVALIVLAVP